MTYRREASEVLAQQFIDGGVIPGQLAGQDAVSKRYVDDQLALRDEAIADAESSAAQAQADIDNHEASTTAHPAQHITYSGAAPGANVKQGIDNTYNRISEIVAQSGDDNTEIVDSRGGHPVLGDRLNASDAQLAEKANNRWFDVIDYKADPSGQENSAAAIQSAIDAAEAAGGGVVYIPAGKYKITTRIVNKEKVSILGDGPGNTIIIADNCDGVKSEVHNISISNFTLKAIGNKYNGLTLSGDYIRVDNISFFPQTNGTDYFEKSIYCFRLWYSTFTRIIIQNGSLGTHRLGYGFYIDYSVNNDIESSQILATNYCVYFSNSRHPVSNYYSEGWTISQNIFIVSNFGVHVAAGTWFDVSNNIIDLIFSKAVYFGLTGGSGSISGNWIAPHSTADPSYISIHVASGDRINISGNQVTGRDGIEAILVQSTSNTISSNTTYRGSVGIRTTGNYNSIIGNTGNLHTEFAIRSEGTYDKIFGNTPGSSGFYRSSNTTKTDFDVYRTTTIISLTGGTSQNINIAIPENTFPSKPNVGFLTSNGTSVIVGSYLFDDPATTATNAVFRVVPVGTANLPNGGVRFSVLMSIS